MILEDYFLFIKDYNVVLTLGIVFGATIVIFVASFIIEFLRQKFFKLIKADKIVAFIEKVCRGIKNLIFKILRIKQTEQVEEVVEELEVPPTTV